MFTICCNTVFNIISGKITSDPPSPPLNLFYATVNLAGGGDNLLAGSFGSTFINDFDGAALASWLQANVTGSSGASLDSGDTKYSFWVLSAAEPTGWTWNGAPVVWNNDGLASLKCFTVTIPTNPNSDAWTMLDIETVMGTQTVQGGLPVYSDPGFAAAWQTYAVQLGGTGLTASITDNVTDVVLTVDNTYLTWIVNTSTDGVNPQQDVYTPCP